MILMIDNYDSFTYNLVQYMGELGAEILVERNDQISIQQIEELNPDKLVVSPGPCTPAKAGISVKLVKHFAGKIPYFGGLPWASVRRGCFRWTNYKSRSPDAWKNFHDTARW